MTRIEEAKELRRQGLKPKEIAEKMGLKRSTVYCYISGSGTRKRAETFGAKVRSIIREQLSSLGLPLEWEDELMKMFSIYHYSDRGRMKGRTTKVLKIDICSLIQLLCRCYRVPTPRKLEILTYQGRGAKRPSSGYMDALQIVDGLSRSQPIDYVKYFIKLEDLPKEEILEAQQLIKKIPKVPLQSRNPRVLAGAVLYEIHKPASPTVNKNRIYTQRYIADKLQVTEQSVRANWIKFFKNA